MRWETFNGGVYDSLMIKSFSKRRLCAAPSEILSEMLND